MEQLSEKAKSRVLLLFVILSWIITMMVSTWAEARVRYKVNDSVTVTFPNWKQERYSDQVTFVLWVNREYYSGELIVGESYNSDKVKWFCDPPIHSGKLESQLWLYYSERKLRLRRR